MVTTMVHRRVRTATSSVVINIFPNISMNSFLFKLSILCHYAFPATLPPVPPPHRLYGPCGTYVPLAHVKPSLGFSSAVAFMQMTRGIAMLSG